VPPSSHTSDNDFDKQYLSLLKKEGKIYSDAQVKVLPRAFAFNPHRADWESRAKSTTDFIDYLKKQDDLKKILQVGSGNGWLCHRISNTFQHQVTGIETVDVLLEQAQRVFKKPNLEFIKGDLFDDNLLTQNYDLIVLSGYIQFFPDLRQLIERCHFFLRSKGELHLIESPIYKWQDIEMAKEAMLNYYDSIQCNGMMAYHHFHSWDDFYPFKYRVLYNPRSISAKLSGVFQSIRPTHPWVRIKKET